jgi:SAM-dependent methyltransferase
MGLSLAASDEPNRFGIQLYHLVATQADHNGKQVSDVSCGHGGGDSYLVRTLHPASCTGLDFNPDGIAFCRRRHDLPGLDFVHGDAESLPCADESFDAVINVEASHAYPRLSRFLAEVVRVLRAGGRFLYADFHGRSEFPVWEAALVDTPMRQVSERVINAEVLRGMEKNSQRSMDLIGSPAAGVYAPVRPPIRRCTRHGALPRHQERENRVPDVLLHQGMSGGVRLSRSPTTGIGPVP